MAMQQEKPKKSWPPGKTKIVRSLAFLLEEKAFSAITIAEIARHAAVTDALIYKYFKDKRDLLHQVLNEYLEQLLEEIDNGLHGIDDSRNRIRKVVWTHIHYYDTYRVFAKILMLEVRSDPGFFSSETFEKVRRYGRIVLDIIEAGVSRGEIRDDLPPRLIRQCLMGCIEQICMSRVIFEQAISPDELTDDVCRFMFAGLAKG